jgi:hypothetical protein
MPSPGPADLVLLLVFVLLVLDSRRLRALASGRRRRAAAAGTGIPAGPGSDQVGLTLRRIQLRQFVDGDDGGTRWPDLEVLPVEEGGYGGPDAAAAPGVGAILPVPVGTSFRILPPPRHCVAQRPTILLDWCLTNDVVRHPVAVLEAAADGE